MKTTAEIANKLADLCRQGHSTANECLKLYSDDAISVEAGGPPGQDPVSRGLAAIRAKGEWWYGAHTIHDLKVTGPYPHGDRFVLGFHIDVTNKQSGQRMKMDEVGLYTVQNGKIIKEEFFYAM